MYAKLNGEMIYLWRAVDHEGEVLESYVISSRDKAAALTFMRKAPKRHDSPEVITTDGLCSYRVAMNELGNAGKHGVGRWANNRLENSHLSFPRRERAMLRFRQMKTLPKFASIYTRLDIMSEEATRMQIILLTCRDRAFRHLGNRITLIRDQ